MIDLDAFYPDIRPSVQGCAIPSMDNAIIAAAIEFCERTRLWRESDTFEVNGSDEVFLIADNGAQIFEIEYLGFDGRELRPSTLADMNVLRPHWRDETANEGTLPGYYIQDGQDSVRLVPRATGKVFVKLVLKPSPDADQLPDFLAAEYRQVIAYGALAKLMMIPGQPFFSPELSSAYRQAFVVALDKRFALNVTGKNRAPARTRTHWF